MGASKKKQTVGYKYYLGFHLIFAMDGITNLRKLMADKKKEIWSGNATSNSTLSVKKKKLFGGKESGGGVKGDIDIEFGGASQSVNSYITSKLAPSGAHVPAFRKRFGLVFKNFYIGTQPSLFALSALLTGDGNNTWYTSKQTISRGTYPDMNPIHMIYNFLVNDTYGLGLPSVKIDDANFKAAADTLYTESLGLSFVWSENDAIEDYLKEILSHIDGALFQDPSTGLFQIKLVRDDYTLGSLTVIDDSNCEVKKIQDMALDETVNSVTVKFHDLNNNTPDTYTVNDVGLTEAMGGAVVSKTISYQGVSYKSLARKLAFRDLKLFSKPLKKVELKCNREANQLKPGDAFKWSNDDEGVTEMVMRVDKVDRGGLPKRDIMISATQDAFAYTEEVFDEANTYTWTDPASEPADITRLQLFERPYQHYLFIEGEFPQDATATGGNVLILAARETATDMYFNSRSRIGAAAYEQYYKTGDFCPVGYLDSSGLTYAATSFTLTDMEREYLVDEDVIEEGVLLYVNGEIMRVDTFDTDTGAITVGRGCLDTVSNAHNGGSLCYFFGVNFGEVANDFEDGDSVNVKLLPINSNGQLAEASATEQTQVMDKRADRVYPPGQLRINGAAYPDAFMGTFTAAWAHRDRITQLADIIDEADADIGPEAGTTYTIEYYDENNVLRDTQNGLVSTSDEWIYEESDSGMARLNNTVRITLNAQRDGDNSTQQHDFTTDRADYGYGYGQYYGGF